MPAAQPPAKYLCLLLAMQRKGNRGGTSRGNLCLWVCNAQAQGEAQGLGPMLLGMLATLSMASVYRASNSSEACGGGSFGLACHLFHWPLSIVE
jgi:hypothetical protein